MLRAETLRVCCSANQQRVSRLRLCGYHGDFNPFHLTFTVRTVFDQTMFSNADVRWRMPVL